MIKDEKTFLDFLDKLRDVQKLQYDYFKYMTSLCTGSILIIIAFHEKVFEKLNYPALIGVSLSLIALSLFSALIVMANEGNLIMYITEMHSCLITNQRDKEKGDKIEKKIDTAFRSINIFQKTCLYGYMVGIVFLIIFVFFNLGPPQGIVR
jgi:superoxide dismutase